MNRSDSIVVTELDARRLRELGSSLAGRGRELSGLRDLVTQVNLEADVIPGAAVPANVVTMNTTLSFAEVPDGPSHRVTVAYPAEASVGERRISVLSPVGRALLGRSVGDVVTVDTPDGASRDIRVLAIHYQPEAAGDFNR